MINVWGDAIGAGVVEALSRKQLAKMDYEEEEGKKDAVEGQSNPSFIQDTKEPGYDSRL